MKPSTLQSFANSRGGNRTDVWELLNTIAKSAGDDVTKGRKAVLDFIVAFGLRKAIESHFDKTGNIDRDIRKALSRLNEEYPFDVVEANQRVSVLFNKYVQLTVGISSYTDVTTLMTTLTNMAENNDTPAEEATPEQLHAWNYLY